MFSFFRSDPLRKLERERESRYREAMEAQKFGDRVRQAELYAQADLLDKEIERLIAERG